MDVTATEDPDIGLITHHQHLNVHARAVKLLNVGTRISGSVSRRKADLKKLTKAKTLQLAERRYR